MWRLRKTSTALSALLCAGALLMLYLVVDIATFGSDEDLELQRIELNSLETKLKSLESDLLLNQRTIDKIRDSVREMQQEQKTMREESKAIRARGQAPVNKTFASIAKGDLAFAQTPPAQCDIRMSDVYDKISFDNPDGGVWKQGWDVTYDKREAMDPKNKLTVIVMPHTHCDPGWIKTYERYYTDQVRHILDNMLVYLGQDPKRKFTYAEVSFFVLWWNEQSLEKRQQALKLLENGQLEILTGGWVMNDEANTYYWAMIEQMILGHEWLDLNLNGYKPK